jgi:hypothetical protein
MGVGGIPRIAAVPGQRAAHRPVPERPACDVRGGSINAAWVASQGRFPTGPGCPESRPIRQSDSRSGHNENISGFQAHDSGTFRNNTDMCDPGPWRVWRNLRRRRPIVLPESWPWRRSRRACDSRTAGQCPVREGGPRALPSAWRRRLNSKGRRCARSESCRITLISVVSMAHRHRFSHIVIIRKRDATPFRAWRLDESGQQFGAAKQANAVDLLIGQTERAPGGLIEAVC